DDATLQIRIKWIMKRLVHTIKPKASLATVMKDMCQFGVLCLPVVDQQGKVQGSVTEASIFKALLKLKSAPATFASPKVRPIQTTFGPTPRTRIQPIRTMETSLVHSL
ncbi:MAG: CBS domain-containing protein, partial [Planctomycetota bacterium]